MQKRSMKPANIDEFIAQYPADVQQKLQQLRQTIHHYAPDAKEKISYGMPTFYLNKNLVHFSAYETHIGFYPGAAAIAEFSEQLKPYDTSKGTVRFPIDKPLPLELVSNITEYCVSQNQV